MKPLEELMAAVRTRYDMCFACGPANPGGLHLDGFVWDDDEVVVDYTPRPEHNGFSGVLHGGIVAAALDEICAWAAIVGAGHYAVTGRLEIRYSREAPASGTYRLRGRIEERRGRRLRVTGRMLQGGEVVASASGLYLLTDRVATTPAGE